MPPYSRAEDATSGIGGESSRGDEPRLCRVQRVVQRAEGHGDAMEEAGRE